MYDQTGKKPVELEAWTSKFLPSECIDVWEHFMMMHRRRGCDNEGNPMRLTFHDIKAYCEVMSEQFCFIELDFICMFDDLFFSQYYKVRKKSLES